MQLVQMLGMKVEPMLLVSSLEIRERCRSRGSLSGVRAQENQGQLYMLGRGMWTFFRRIEAACSQVAHIQRRPLADLWTPRCCLTTQDAHDGCRSA